MMVLPKQPDGLAGKPASIDSVPGNQGCGVPCRIILATVPLAPYQRRKSRDPGKKLQDCGVAWSYLESWFC
jgi:hypothetical protein